MMSFAALGLFLLAVLITGVFGTETRTLFFWPGAALLGLAGGLATLKWRWRILFPPSDVCLASMLVFAIYLGARAAASPVVAYAREDGVILAACVITYVLTLTLAGHPKWRMALVVTMLTLAVGNLAVGSVHLSGNWGFHLVPNFIRATEPGRVGGFFVNPNHLAAFLSVVLFVSAGWLCFGRGGAVLKLWLGFMTVAMAVGMSLTVSRGALLGLAVGGGVFACLAFWIIWQTQRHFFWSLLGGSLVAALLAGAVLWKVNDEYLRSRIASHTVTSDVRVGIWESALAQHATAPWWGAGARMFYDGGTQHRSPKLPTWASEPLFAHNEYLQMLADYGWVGLVCVTFMVLAHGLNGLRFLRWFVREKFMLTGRVLSMNLALCVGSLAALAASMTHAVVEFQYHVPITALCGALLLGWLASPGFETMQRPLRRLPGVRLATKLALALSSALLLLGVWKHGPADEALAQAEAAKTRQDRATQRAELDRATRLDPMLGEAFYQRGLAVLDAQPTEAAGDQTAALQAAIEDLERAVRLCPSQHLYALALADAYDATKRHEEARKAIETALMLAPHHEEPRLALGMHWMRLGQWQKAEDAFLWARQAQAMNPKGTANWLSAYHWMLQNVAYQRAARAAP